MKIQLVQKLHRFVWRVDGPLNELSRMSVELRTMREVHDRFIVVDETVYHIGASIENSQAESCGQACLDVTETKNFGSKSNDLGNKLTAFSVLSLLAKQQLLEMIK